MNSSILYIIFLLFELIIYFSIAIFLFSLLYSSIMGAPYVPSRNQEFKDTIDQANLKKNQVFIELGSGDGRVVRYAVRQYQVKGIGIEINPLLFFYASLLAKLQQINYIEFRRQNIFKTDLTEADVIYIFLMPELIKKLVSKLEQEIKSDCLIISHGFKIPGWEKFIVKKIQRKIFSSYYYQRDI